MRQVIDRLNQLLERLHEQPSPLMDWLRRIAMERLTPGGRAFFWTALIFSGLVPFSSLGFHQVELFCLCLGLWLTAAVTAVVFRPQVAVTLDLAERVSVGQSVSGTVIVEQLGRLPGLDLWVTANRMPAGMSVEPADGVVLPDLWRGQAVSVPISVRCERRGRHTFGGLRVGTAFPFGMSVRYRVFETTRPLLVVPSFRVLDRLDLPLGRSRQPGGVPLAGRVGESTDFVGNREFREGDSVRDIDWRATARLGRPIVRERREEYLVRVAVLLDTHVPSGLTRRETTARRADLERAVSLTAAISDAIARQEHLIDLFAAGPELYRLTAGRSLACLDQILDILACVEESSAEPFSVIEPELAEDLSAISAVVGVFLDWDEPRRNLMDSLRRMGVGVRAIVVRDGTTSRDAAADADWAGARGRLPVLGPSDFAVGVEEL